MARRRDARIPTHCRDDPSFASRRFALLQPRHKPGVVRDGLLVERLVLLPQQKKLIRVDQPVLVWDGQDDYVRRVWEIAGRRLSCRMSDLSSLKSNREVAPDQDVVVEGRLEC